MGRPPLRNAGNVKKVESAVRNNNRHTVRYIAEITGKPTVHRILKSDLKGICKMGFSFLIGR